MKIIGDKRFSLNTLSSRINYKLLIRIRRSKLLPQRKNFHHKSRTKCFLTGPVDKRLKKKRSWKTIPTFIDMAKLYDWYIDHYLQLARNHFAIKVVLLGYVMLS